jgi:dTDP-4-dehydrorhamnose 3,5-epimerase
MIEGVIIKKLNKNIDDRGWLTEIFRQDEISFFPAMGYISVTKPGIIRGPHEHDYQSDCFIFCGPGDFELHLWDRREDSLTEKEYVKISAGENNPLMVIVPPGVVHGYKCVSDKDAWCINLPNKLYRGQGKDEEVDEIRWEKRENSQYIIN